ncbi:rhomboid family intramembrane serine protease [Amylibacter marinus]|uniref:Rhomboid family intramembrane serine protease n=1 Tax=Amylibacter marinus TaxID=1475483 RepID=A0ABQ5VUM8_9RHOB|nr:rhomboid family intramembrane serine protease [Amylibacter marinus]GLQ34896.1 rhomboid family intramembrane serine protease [Amylibacter marinus]
MFPFRDHNPSRRPAYVTWALMAVNILVFLTYVPILDQPRELGAFFATWALVPAEFSAGIDYHTVLTSMFLHGGLMHIAGNMLFLWIFGDNVEDAMGHITFLIFYLLAGFGAAMAQVLVGPHSPVPMVGASGAIAGVMGAYLLLYPRAKVDVLIIFVVFFKVFTLPAYVVLAVWMGMQFFGELSGGAGIAYWAHIGGFMAGGVLAIPVFLRLGGARFWKDADYHPPHKPTFESRTTNIPIIKRRR